MGVTAHHKPRITLLIDEPNWAFHTLARAIKSHLSQDFIFEIAIASLKLPLDLKDTDILHVFGAEQLYHLLFLQPHVKVVKSIYSHRWEIQRNESAEEFYNKYLLDAHALTASNRLLIHRLNNLPIPVALFCEGVDTNVFRKATPRSGSIRVGWAGNSGDPIKNFSWVQKVCEELCELKIAEGQYGEREMVNFYHDIDIILCTSCAEGAPRPILEAMSCGRYPVSFSVGMVPEIIIPDEHGTIVNEFSVDALRSALKRCCKHPDMIRTIGQHNADWIRSTHTWDHTIHSIKDIYMSLL
ncbi:glycosyltransferase family 4 protein [Patescibacteria group bacterium]|nr:glycosyltransferase family 4 protein [Patescibacteria group bacterium]